MAAGVVSFCPEVLFLVLVGYDLAAEEGVKALLDKFDQEVGLHYLRAMHLNDSKGTARTFTHKKSHMSIRQMICSLSCTTFVTFMNLTLLCKVSQSFLSFFVLFCFLQAN